MAVVAELRIRPMTDADLERIVEVWERSRRDAQPWLDERMAYTHEDSLRHFREVIAREYQVWVAQEDGDAPVALLAVADSVVGYLYVDPTAQGRGVGSALLARAFGLPKIFEKCRNIAQCLRLHTKVPSLLFTLKTIESLVCRFKFEV